MELSNVEPTVAQASAILDRVLVLIDYSMDSHRALGVALELGRTHGSTVRLFHAAHSYPDADYQGGIGSPAVGGDWVEQAKERLARFMANVAPASAGAVELSARVGEALEVLGEEIEEWKPTLVVAAAAVHTRIFRGQAGRLLDAASLPTLIIPATPS